MIRNPRWTLVLSSVTSCLLATSLPAQQLDAVTTLVRPYVARDASIGASNTVLHLLSIAGAVTGGVVGGATGYAIDQQQCRGPDNGLFPSCTLQGRSATRVGWIGGSVIGAAAAGAIVATWRGCPTKSAVLRSLGGAAVGVLPGAIAATRNPVHYSATRAIFLGTTPVFAGVGSALAVMHCAGT